MGEWADAVEALAAERLPASVYRYFRQGSRDGLAAAEATAAWDRYRFLPRVLRDVTAVDLTTTLLGTPVTAPLAVAPTTLQRAADPAGERAMAGGVRAAGSLLVVSSNAGTDFADIGRTGVPWWVQCYVAADRGRSQPLLEHAVANGARAVVLTVDTPVVGSKYDGRGPTVWDEIDPAWLRVNDRGGGPAGRGEKAADLSPGDIAWLAAETGLPVVAKGVLRPDDASDCLDAGAAAIWVSNHGGRQLDRAAPTADCLAGVVDAVGQRAEVYVDGGVRAAGQAAVALALGARAVFLGRLPLYALAVAGEAGVERLLQELGADLEEVLQLLGSASLDAVDRTLLAPCTCCDRHHRTPV